MGQLGKYWIQNPPYNRTERHKDRSWYTVEGWDWNSKRLANGLIREGMRRGGWKYGITINSPRTHDLGKFLNDWQRITDQLRRKGVAAFFQIEVSPTDRWHVHGVSTATVRELRDAWKAVAPNGWTLRISKLKSWRNWRNWCRYIVKTKDYQHKRCIFRNDLGTFRKNTTINGNKFWTKSVTEYWQEVIDREREIAGYESDGRFIRLLSEVSEATGFTARQLRYKIDPQAQAFVEWSNTIEKEDSENDRHQTFEAVPKARVSGRAIFGEEQPQAHNNIVLRRDVFRGTESQTRAISSTGQGISSIPLARRVSEYLLERTPTVP